MHQHFSNSSFKKGDNYISYGMPFGGEGSIQFVLPNEGTDVEELIQDQETIQQMLEYTSLESADVNFSLPKVDYESNLNLVSMLQKLGITDAFNPSACNLSKLTKSGAVISQVLQGVRVKFEEVGVEAAAYTMIEIRATSAMMPSPTVNIVLNRPFFYAIKNAEGNILFSGIIRTIN